MSHKTYAVLLSIVTLMTLSVGLTARADVTEPILKTEATQYHTAQQLQVAALAPVIYHPRLDRDNEAMLTAQRLAATGAAGFLSGAALNLLAIPFASAKQYEVAAALLLTGTGAQLLFPILSALGERKAKNAIHQKGISALRRTSHSGLSGGQLYGIAWLISGIGFGLVYIGAILYLEYFVLVSFFGSAALAYAALAAAALGPLIRIRRWKRQHGQFRQMIVPMVGQNFIGAQLTRQF